jgi:hypothetical protein
MTVIARDIASAVPKKYSNKINRLRLANQHSIGRNCLAGQLLPRQKKIEKSLCLIQSSKLKCGADSLPGLIALEETA